MVSAAAGAWWLRAGCWLVRSLVVALLPCLLYDDMMAALLFACFFWFLTGASIIIMMGGDISVIYYAPGVPISHTLHTESTLVRIYLVYNHASQSPIPNKSIRRLPIIICLPRLFSIIDSLLSSSVL